MTAPRRKTLSDPGVAALKPKATRYAHPDPELRGHYVRVTPNGAKAFVVVTRDPSGKQVWATVGPTDRMSIAEAREKGREGLARIAAGKEAFPPPPRKEQTFAEVWANFYDQHIVAKGLRSGGEFKRVVEKHAIPEFGDRQFVDVSRRDIAELLDDVEEGSGPSQADKVLTHLSKISNWYAARHDTYSSPIVKGMKRSEAKGRERVLTDDEIKVVWDVAARSRTAYGDIVRLALLTGQRRAKIVSMRFADIGEDGLWTIQTLEREKGNPGFLTLPAVAHDIIRSRPEMAKNPHVFPGRGSKHLNSFSQMKAEFDELLPAKFAAWTTHDLRRTARTLMSRAGVQSDISERVLGHTIGGVEGVYDRHTYADEKKRALEALAELISEIVK